MLILPPKVTLKVQAVLLHRYVSLTNFYHPLLGKINQNEIGYLIDPQLVLKSPLPKIQRSALKNARKSTVRVVAGWLKWAKFSGFGDLLFDFYFFCFFCSKSAKTTKREVLSNLHMQIYIPVSLFRSFFKTCYSRRVDSRTLYCSRFLVT